MRTASALTLNLRHRLETHQTLYHFLRTANAILQRIGQDDITGLASQMAYNLILSIIPALIFLISLMGLWGQSAQSQFLDLMNTGLNRLVPPHTSDLLIPTLQGIVQSSSGKLTVIGLAGALWGAAGAAGAFIKGSTVIFGIPKEKQPFWFSPVYSILMMLSLGLMQLLSAYVIIFGDRMLQWVSHFIPLNLDWLLLIQVLRYVIPFLGLTFFSSFSYALILRIRTGKLCMMTTLPGGLIFVSFWLVLSILFGWYVNNLHQFNPIYGTLGGVVILVTWLYFSSLTLLIGAEVIARSMDWREGKFHFH